MKLFTAEYTITGQYGIGVCTADTIEELIKILGDRGFAFRRNQKEEVVEWSKTTDKKFYGIGLTIRRGDSEMTEYTSC